MNYAKVTYTPAYRRFFPPYSPARIKRKSKNLRNFRSIFEIVFWTFYSAVSLNYATTQRTAQTFPTLYLIGQRHFPRLIKLRFIPVL